MKWNDAEENRVNVGLINISLPFGVSVSFESHSTGFKQNDSFTQSAQVNR